MNGNHTKQAGTSGTAGLTLGKTLIADDGSEKLVFVPAGQVEGQQPGLEAVLLVNDKGRATACLSSQLGCAMGCRFCATGQMGLLRNCSADEIIAQFDAVKARAAARNLDLTNAVFMGMGEALHNLDAVLEAVGILTDQKGRNIFPRRITISTAGYLLGIRRLAAHRPALGLAFSLISAREEIRNRLIPASGTGFLGLARAALDEYHRETNKRIILEMVIFDRINHDSAEADAVADFCRGLDCLVNVIPWNPISSPPLVNAMTMAVPHDNAVHGFAMMLSERGVANTVRHTKGRQVLGACGQLGDRG